MSQNTTLDSFSNANVEDTNTPNTTNPAESSNSTRVEHLNQEDLPDIFSWNLESHTLYKDATVINPHTTDLRKLTSDCAIYPQTVAYIVDGFKDYLRTTNSRKLSIPGSYSELKNDFAPRITGYSCGSKSAEYGITQDKLEAAIRIATGGGRYNKSDVSVYIGDPFSFVITYDNHKFLIRTVGLDQFSLNSEPIVEIEKTPRDINGFEIVEDDPQYRHALSVFTDQVNTVADLNLCEYDRLYGSKHVFVDQSGKEIRIGQGDLRKLTPAFKDETELIGEHTISPRAGSDQTFELPEIPYQVGEEHRYQGTVIGHRLKYKPKVGGALSLSRQRSCMVSEPDEANDLPDKDYQPLTIRDEAEIRLLTYVVSGLEKNPSIKDRPPYKRINISSFSTPVAKYTLKNMGFNTHPQFWNEVERSSEN